MKNYINARNAYLSDHLSKKLEQPNRRINALSAIESSVKKNEPELLSASNLFANHTRQSFSALYENWKGSSLSGAEKSVIKGLFDFAIE
ncbi:MAG: hypothetical protein ACOCUT_03305 [bacterium]